jgi:hypothetical protein
MVFKDSSKYVLRPSISVLLMSSLIPTTSSISEYSLNLDWGQII